VYGSVWQVGVEFQGEKLTRQRTACIKNKLLRKQRLEGSQLEAKNSQDYISTNKKKSWVWWRASVI
jgi:hypothetical protein